MEFEVKFTLRSHNLLLGCFAYCVDFGDPVTPSFSGTFSKLNLALVRRRHKFLIKKHVFGIIEGGDGDGDGDGDGGGGQAGADEHTGKHGHGAKNVYVVSNSLYCFLSRWFISRSYFEKLDLKMLSVATAFELVRPTNDPHPQLSSSPPPPYPSP